MHDHGDQLSMGWIDQLVDQLNSYYDVHGRWPATYFDLQDCPTFCDGTLPFAADDGWKRGQMIKKYGFGDIDTDAYDEAVAADAFTLKLKLPDTDTPTTSGDWEWHTISLDDYPVFQTLLKYGDHGLGAPEFQPRQRKTGDR